MLFSNLEALTEPSKTAKLALEMGSGLASARATGGVKPAYSADPISISDTLWSSMAFARLSKA